MDEKEPLPPAETRWVKWARLAKQFAIASALLTCLFNWVDSKELESLFPQPARRHVDTANFIVFNCLRYCGSDRSLRLEIKGQPAFRANCTGLKSVCGASANYKTDQVYRVKNVELIEIQPNSGVVKSMEIMDDEGVTLTSSNPDAEDYASFYHARKNAQIKNRWRWCVLLIAYALLTHFAARKENLFKADLKS